MPGKTGMGMNTEGIPKPASWDVEERRRWLKRLRSQRVTIGVMTLVVVWGAIAIAGSIWVNFMYYYFPEGAPPPRYGRVPAKVEIAIIVLCCIAGLAMWASLRGYEKLASRLYPEAWESIKKKQPYDGHSYMVESALISLIIFPYILIAMVIMLKFPFLGIVAQGGWDMKWFWTSCLLMVLLMGAFSAFLGFMLVRWWYVGE